MQSRTPGAMNNFKISDKTNPMYVTEFGQHQINRTENADIILLPGQKIHGLLPHPLIRLPKNPAEAQFAERMQKGPVRVFASC
ncbi:unnamed protein product [Sphagnum balticum]